MAFCGGLLAVLASYYRNPLGLYEQLDEEQADSGYDALHNLKPLDTARLQASLNLCPKRLAEYGSSSRCSMAETAVQQDEEPYSDEVEALRIRIRGGYVLLESELKLLEDALGVRERERKTGFYSA